MTTAPLAAQLKLLDLAELDTALRQSAHRRRSLPEHAELTELAERRARLATDAAQARTAVSDLERAVRKAEADVEQVRVRAGRDSERLNSGQTSAKDLQGLQHELASLAKRQTELEDAELELMEQLETAQAELDGVLARIDETETAAERATARRDESIAEIDRAEADLRTRRSMLVASVDPPLAAIYERVQQTSGGVAAARLVGGRCGGCRVEVPPAEMAVIRRAAPEEVLQCEECRCVLVRDR